MGIRQNIGENKTTILHTAFMSDQLSAFFLCRYDFRERAKEPAGFPPFTKITKKATSLCSCIAHMLVSLATIAALEKNCLCATWATKVE